VGSKQRAPRLGAKRSRSHLRKTNSNGHEMAKKKEADGDCTSRIVVMVGALDLRGDFLGVVCVSVRGFFLFFIYIYIYKRVCVVSFFIYILLYM
jgi:hypothetical protein